MGSLQLARNDHSSWLEHECDVRPCLQHPTSDKSIMGRRNAEQIPPKVRDSRPCHQCMFYEWEGEGAEVKPCLDSSCLIPDPLARMDLTHIPAPPAAL